MDMPLAVYPVVEQSHQQKTVATRKQSHAARPYTFHHRHLETPQPPTQYQSHTDKQQLPADLQTVVFAVFHQPPGKGAQHHRHSKGQTAPNPGVSGVSAETPHNQLIDLMGKISFGCKIPGKCHRNPIDNKQGCCGPKLYL